MASSPLNDKGKVVSSSAPERVAGAAIGAILYGGPLLLPPFLVGAAAAKLHAVRWPAAAVLPTAARFAPRVGAAVIVLSAPAGRVLEDGLRFVSWADRDLERFQGVAAVGAMACIAVGICLLGGGVGLRVGRQWLPAGRLSKCPTSNARQK